MRGAGQRAGAQGRCRGALSGLGDALAVPPERFDVREKVMREGDRLRALKVRVSGEDRLHLILSTRDERSRELEHRALEIVQQLDHEETQVERDLIVAASCGMKLAGDLARARAQSMLDRGVH